MNYYPIEPTQDFVSRTMARVRVIHRRKYLFQSAIIISIAFSPVVIREVWLVFRGDYFSVSHMPMGPYISQVYRLFISPFTRYIFLTIAASAAGIFFLRSRRVPYASLRLR